MLITLEGIDGSGKTMVGSAVEEDYPDVVVTHEPTDSWYGEAVRRSIGDDDADPLAELFLYTADHAHHLAATVAPALSQERVVVSDRYVDSRYAYQGVSLADTLSDPVGFVQAIHTPWTREPEATLYFDVDPEIAVSRTGQANKFERAEFLSRVRDAYEGLIRADPDRFVRIDASQDQAGVVDEALRAVERLLASRPE